MKDYRKKAVTGYNICYRQYLKTAVSILLQYIIDRSKSDSS